MPQIPHCDTLRKYARSDPEFVAFVELIRSHGYNQKFYSRTYRYLDLDGWQHWTMGCVIDSTILINRAETHREDILIKPNPVPLSPQDWPECWCPKQKRLVPRQPDLGLD